METPSPQTIDTVLTHVETYPVTLALWLIVALLAALGYWTIRKLLPWLDERQKQSQEHVERVAASRDKAASEDLRQAQVLAETQMKLVTTEIGAKIDRGFGEIRNDLLRIGGKTSVVIFVLWIVTSSGAVCGESGLVYGQTETWDESTFMSAVAAEVVSVGAGSGAGAGAGGEATAPSDGTKKRPVRKPPKDERNCGSCPKGQTCSGGKCQYIGADESEKTRASKSTYERRGPGQPAAVMSDYMRPNWVDEMGYLDPLDRNWHQR